ncbi:MAG: MurT ligase domain-containing protein [Eggerthellaceae bacterium]|jgi:CobQ-like glutamine amidotransferase family enzyme/UDP-N-acetylmuramyl tripeptide synthase
MGLRFEAAKAIGAVSTWGIRNIAHRSAATFPGKFGMYADPQLIAHLRSRLQQGSVLVVGTNGKTTSTNLLANVFETAGLRTVCNRTGANLSSGTATALLHTDEADWGVFESDELWLARTLPQLKATYVLLLNLFPDQLDRMGKIENLQDSIVEGLKSSPETILVYNADDPWCEMIAKRAGNKSIPFGVGEDMRLSSSDTKAAQICQQCGNILTYDFRQYSQLGSYHCEYCNFSRSNLFCTATDVKVSQEGLSFSVDGFGKHEKISAPFGTTYMVYNLLGVYATATAAGIDPEIIQKAIDEFDPKNGRLEPYVIKGRKTLLNLAKNPAGFNQNIAMILSDKSPKAVAMFVNDEVGDGKDVSWYWDIDAAALQEEPNLRIFVGGARGLELQMRLKYAGLKSEPVKNGKEFFEKLENVPTQVNAYILANYTALPPVKAELDAMPSEQKGIWQDASTAWETPRVKPAYPKRNQKPLVIAQIYPELLNLFGESGNVEVLAQRARWRGIPVDLRSLYYGDKIDLSGADIVVLGGGSEREMKLAFKGLLEARSEIETFIDAGGVMLAVGGGYQMMGRTWVCDSEELEGLGIFAADTLLPLEEKTAGKRAVGDIIIQAEEAKRPVVGFENHMARTYPDPDTKNFGHILQSCGIGNNEADQEDGIWLNNALGTYLHGILLAKNPEIADNLLQRAQQRYTERTGEALPELQELDDALETAANEFMCSRYRVGV